MYQWTSIFHMYIHVIHTYKHIYNFELAAGDVC
jgi:hypothetical protein